MPIISKRVSPEVIKHKVELEADIDSELQEYMEWAGVKNISHCIEDALRFVFKSDKEWKRFKKEQNKAVSA